MSKKVLMTCLAVAIGVIGLHGTAEAGNWSFLQPPGMWWYYGSVDGCAAIGSVPNPDKKPAILKCEIDLKRIETLCENPQNKDVRPGEAATKVVVFNTIDPEDLLDSKGQKYRGQAELCVGFDEVTSLPADILCVNRNWHPIGALTTEFTATCKTEQCTGEDDLSTPNVNEACNITVPKDTQRCECSLPYGSVESPPSPRTPYSCIEVDAYGIPTGNMCELAP